MSVCMVGLAAGQLLVGPMSDKYGRRAPLLFSMWLFALSTIGCVFATDIYFFVAMRFFQGVAGAGGIALSRSISADKYSGLELARFLAIIAAVHSIAPVAAPVVGGVMLSFYSWRAVFVCLALLGAVLLWLSYRVGESLPRERRSSLSFFGIFKLYGNVVCDRVAIFYILQQGAMYSILFGYISASPFIFENVYGLQPIAFSGVFALNAIGIGIGAAVSAKFSRRRTAVVCAGAGVLAAALFGVSAILFDLGVYAVESALFTMMFFFGLSTPAAAAIVLDSQRENAGTAAALLGALPFFVGSLAAPLVGLCDIKTDFAFVIVVGGILAFVLALVARAYQKKFGPSVV